MRSALSLSLVVACILGSSACEVLPGGTVSSELEGVYTIESWEVDQPTCQDGPQNNVLFERFVVVAASDIVRGAHLFAYPCVELDSCAELQDDSLLPGLVPFSSSLVDGGDEDGWSGSTDFEYADADDSNLCHVGRTMWSLERDGENGIVRRTETTVGTLTGVDDCEEASLDDVPDAERCTESADLVGVFEQAVPPVPPTDEPEPVE